MGCSSQMNVCLHVQRPWLNPSTETEGPHTILKLTRSRLAAPTPMHTHRCMALPSQIHRLLYQASTFILCCYSGYRDNCQSLGILAGVTTLKKRISLPQRSSAAKSSSARGGNCKPSVPGVCWFDLTQGLCVGSQPATKSLHDLVCPENSVLQQPSTATGSSCLPALHSMIIPEPWGERKNGNECSI